MGQKINPYGFRLGIGKDWMSRWYASKKDYANFAHEDMKLRKFLKQKLELAGVKSVEIERSLSDIKILVKVSKPGVVIGKAGTGIESIEKELKKLTESKIKITVEEIKNPETEAELVAQYICRQLKRRIPARRIANAAISSAVDKGVKGIKVQIKGLLSGSNTIARSETYKQGAVPLQTLRSDIDYAQKDCQLLYGTVGIKVWIYKGEMDI
ncbi:30S ribosomal protein S3 [candidate division WWE3 bacterium RBG_19FT_COMBO_34_6]|uniref:Small ribosomal subunit protein uS3 n=1 Tax=candidate division WWE3 bacterium RBG_19FT_COMBO_34_6 TaxID=1802612 RepID=A0A1F4UJN0_UNCKA|nr:MAG: 30S ribosomal protein S3 [candidate division WWE3 bacterium RBG_19FT_COMBO_34_6]